MTDDDSLETKLHQLSHGRLVELFADVLHANPDIRQAVELHLHVEQIAEADAEGTADYDEYYRRAEKILQSALDRRRGDWQATREATSALAPLFEAGGRFFDADQPENASIVAAALFDALVDNYQHFDDSGAHYSTRINRAADLLCRAFGELTDDYARSRMLEKLWDADFGGMGVMDSVAETLTEQARTAERHFLLDALDEYVDRIDAGEVRDSTWRRSAIADFALSLEADETG